MSFSFSAQRHAIPVLQVINGVVATFDRDKNATQSLFSLISLSTVCVCVCISVSTVSLSLSLSLSLFF